MFTSYQGRRHHTDGRYQGRHGKCGAFARELAEELFEDEDGAPVFHWKPRGGRMVAARDVLDFDWTYRRSRHSTGWMEHKYRHPWEHRARVQEKHLRGSMV